MTHYNDNPGVVRVDYFKPSGKWYMTEAHDMSDYWDEPDIYRRWRVRSAEMGASFDTSTSWC